MTIPPDRRTTRLGRVLNIVNIESLFFSFLIGMTVLSWNVPSILCVIVGLAMIVIFQILFRRRISYLIVTGLFSLFWAWCFCSAWFNNSAPVIGVILGVGSFAAFLFCHVQAFDEEQARNKEE